MTDAEKMGLQSIAERCYMDHAAKCNIWQHGNITESWFDEDGNVCVKYDDGAWWHYRYNGLDVEWW